MKKAKKSVTDLPEEMLTKILLPLPIKSLGQCKSVCKAWLSIISNPHFIKSHVHHAIKNPTVLILITNDNAELRQQREGTVMTLDTSPVRVDSLVMPRMFFKFPVVGSCNGILCLENMSCNVVYLWNPCTRQYRRILAPLQCRTGYEMGFGYDSISDDYKVLCILMSKVLVYSSNADSWRQIHDPILEKVQMGTKTNIVAVKGELYFDCTNDGLISFDLHKEVFRLVTFPSIIQSQMSKILDFKGSLAVVYESVGDGPEFDVWTLDDASDQVSWTKKSRIDISWRTLDIGSTIQPHGHLGGEKIYGLALADALRDDFEYVFCDYEKREYKFYGLGEVGVHAALKYTETLVSLEGFQQVE